MRQFFVFVFFFSHIVCLLCVNGNVFRALFTPLLLCCDYCQCAVVRARKETKKMFINNFLPDTQISVLLLLGGKHRKHQVRTNAFILTKKKKRRWCNKKNTKNFLPTNRQIFFISFFLCVLNYYMSTCTHRLNRYVGRYINFYSLCTQQQ